MNTPLSNARAISDSEMISEPVMMELKCAVASSVLRFFLERFGKDKTSEIIADTSMSLRHLEDTNNWISFADYCRLLRKLVEITGNPMAPRDVSSQYTNPKTWGSVAVFLKHLGTPADVYRLVVGFHRLWNRISEWRIEEIRSDYCRMSVLMTKYAQDKNNCLAIQGSLTTAPCVFGLPPAEVREVHCACEGARACVYEVHWLNRPVRIRGLSGALVGTIVGMFWAYSVAWSSESTVTLVLSLLLGYFIGHESDYQISLKNVYQQTEEQAASLVESIRAIEALNRELEQRVRERTAQLEVANKELEAFSYSVSHDLRSPLRSIDGFSLAVLQDNTDRLDAQSVRNLQRVQASAQRMGLMIDGLLALSRVTRQGIRTEQVDLSLAAETIAQELQMRQPERTVEFVIAKNLVTQGDPVLLRIVLQNLLDNAWKYTSNNLTARIEFGTVELSKVSTCSFKSDLESRKAQVFFVRDDGAGFDMQYAGKLFGAFQRLHTEKEFGGTGIGLATVQRIIHRHGGKVWAESEVGKGSVFYFAL